MNSSPRAEAPQHLLTSALEVTANAVIITDRDGLISWVNPAFTRLTGYSPDEVCGRKPSLLKSGTHEPSFYRRLWQTIRSGQVWRAEMVNRRKDGSLYTEENTITPVRDAQGAITHFIAIKQDITERKRDEESFRLFRALLDQSNDAIEVLDPETGRYLDANEAAWRELGYTREELLSLSILQVDCLLDRAAYLQNAEQLRQSGSLTLESQHRRKDGSIFPVEVNIKYVQLGRAYIVAVARNITERKRAEEERSRLAAIVRSANDAIVGTTLAGVLVSWNEAAERIYGYAAAEVLGKHFRCLIPPECLAERLQAYQQVQHGAVFPPQEQVRVRKDGRRIHISLTDSPVKDATGKVVGVSTIVRDITERKQVEKELRDSEEKFRQLAESITEVFWIANPDITEMIYVSPAYEKIWGRACQALYAQPRSFAEAIHPEDRERVLGELSKHNQGEPYTQEYRIVRPDGSVRWIYDRGFPIRNEAGELYRFAGLAEDVTERKQLEQQLRQAQKMDAIGQLAGGIAHDFNNLLAVICGNTELVLTGPGELHPENQDCLKQIVAAAERAANLTRQLLVFSRKQTMQTQRLVLNEVIANLTKMLKRIIGEHIDLQCHYAEDLPCVQADAGMLEQVLVNLVVNARDAMPRGGGLQVETASLSVNEAHVQANPEARLGQFVCLTVRDTGTGIAPEHLPRIFEPFFTTKEVGKGTGLGLATVYGIAKQHQGWLEVSSLVGVGSTFKMYLPAVSAPKAASAEPAAEAPPRGGSETILLVEDELPVRVVSRRVLENHGYKVLEAASGPEALRFWNAQSNTIDLVLTDVIMPQGMSGCELAEQLLVSRPALKVLLMSGYSPEAMGKEANFLKRTKAHFLQKPFSSRTLAQAVRACLDQP